LGEVNLPGADAFCLAFPRDAAMRRELLVVLFVVLGWIRPAAAAEPDAGDLLPARNIDTWIDLSGSLRPAIVLCPDLPEYRKAAGAVAEAIEKLGARRPEVTCDPQKALPETHDVIALGNVNNNRLIARLYFNHYAMEDSLLPGPGGMTIRTVYDPYPWHGQGDVVVLGVSQACDASQAAARLIEKIAPGKTAAGIDYTLEISTASALTEGQIETLDAEQTPSFHTFLSSARRYLQTGREPYARHAVATLRRIADRYAEDPRSDCDWPEETSSADILATWDAFEECPLMTHSERRQFTGAMLQFMRSLVRHVSGYSQVGTDDLVSWNHTTFPLMGLYFGSRYFHDYYGLDEAEKHLEKARACMLAQARSWKPQEDADTYLTITMGHTIDYCLAEWELDFFESGCMRQYADYVIGIGDSIGWPSGFGDSGIGRSPMLIPRAVPVAFWWYRDPGYLWVLEHVHGGAWANPFHRDVAAEEPDRHSGVCVFPLDSQLYEFTRRRSFYDEPVAPPNASVEAAFDKIAFRESWDAEAQYLLLDGFSRGKHLHYDGNAIIELVDRGQRWLIDHDYLTRNTTEHNMLSVIRNGRSTELVPSCAGLVCASDAGPAIGLATTEMRDYCGIDWRRHVFWLKGDAFVVLDRMTARQDADYDLDLVWKVEDQGDERLVSDGEFLVRRSEFPGRTKHAQVVADETASQGKAVVFDQSESALTFTVDLPAGEYAVAVVGYGAGTSSDSVFVSSMDGERAMVGVPHDRYSPSAAARPRSGSPRLKLAGTQRQVVSVTLREAPPVRIDKIVFFDPDGKVRQVIEAEQTTPPTEDDVANARAQRFWIKWPDPVQAAVKRSAPKGIVVPVCRLCQRTSRPLKIGQTAEVANLLYTDETTEPIDYEIQRITYGAVLLRGPQVALCAVRGAKIDGLAFDADMLFLSPTCIAWANGRSLSLGQAQLSTADVSNLELDPATSQAAAEKADGKPVAIEANRLSSDAVRRLLASLADGTVKGRAREATPPPAAQSDWATVLDGEAPVRRLKTADLDGDGSPEILVAAGNRAFVLETDGRIRWSYALEGICYDVEAGELIAESPGPEIAVAGGDTYVHLLSAAGKPIGKQQIRGAVWNQNFGDRPWAAYTVGVRDLNQDGANEILVGTQNMELHLYDAAWNLLSRARRAVLHGSIDFHTVDADLDGKLELFATDHYGRVQTFRHDGSKDASFYTSIGDMQATLADLDGDGRVELIYGSSTGDLLCTKLPESGPWQRGAKTLWRFDNFGYGVNRLRSADVDADGSPEIVVASEMGYLFVLDREGNLEWQDRVGTGIVDALVVGSDGPRLAYFDQSGTFCLASGDGGTRKRRALGFTPVTAVQLGDAVLVAGAGKVVCYRVEEAWEESL